jgi:hypothetical protein
MGGDRGWVARVASHASGAEKMLRNIQILLLCNIEKMADFRAAATIVPCRATGAILCAPSSAAQERSQVIRAITGNRPDVRIETLKC